MTKTFKFKAEPATAGSFVPSGVSYTWKVGTRNVGTGSEITPSISTLRNNSTAVPTVNQTLYLSCEVSLTGCDTVTSSSQMIEFAAPKTFDTSITSGITDVTTALSASQYAGDSTTDFKVTSETWETPFTIGLADSVILPSGCTISWSISCGSGTLTGTERRFTLTPKQFTGKDNYSAWGGATNYYLKYTITAPGYETILAPGYGINITLRSR
ncbi:MAG: hypothetical protein IJM03_03225 [Treponema sp.]|nr:hypothetical protein [Treponema sp.]